MKYIAQAARLAVEQLENRTLLTAVAGWTTLASAPKARGLTPSLRLADYQPLTLTVGTIANTLSKVPLENLKYGIGRGANSRLISIPTPDGDFDRFRIVESAILTGADARKFSNIKTYAGVGVDDPSANIRLDYTPLGFHAQVLTLDGNGAYYVDPLYNGNRTTYASYYSSEARGPVGQTNQIDVDVVRSGTASTTAGRTAATNQRTSGTQLRTYRTAIATTGEYATAVAPQGTTATVASTLAAVVTAMTRVSGIYESELSIRLTLIGNESTLINTNSATDGYTNDDANALLTENQSNIDSKIGNANYDIGHVFGTGGGGLASLAVVGSTGNKAQGETGSPVPLGDAYYVDYVAHEMGHQFGANHTFNTTTGNASGNRNAQTAYEVGSGSTIMGYAGITGSTGDSQLNSDPFFAWKSIDEILGYVDTGAYTIGASSYSDTEVLGAGTRTNTTNHVPTVSGPGNFTIPINTPFALTATGSDADNDSLYYSWEEADLGSAQALNAAQNTTSPLFRVYNPTVDPTRTFPRLPSILAGSLTTAGPASGTFVERLPTLARTMKFVITARDQHPGGGGTNVLSGTTTNVTTVAAASGFAISNFNTTSTVAGGSNQTITWNVAGTTGNGINTSQVNILMSTDGGTTFPTTLAAGTANDGTETVQMPFGTASNQVRFKVAAVGNIYFDINNANLTITNVSAPSVTPGVPDLVAATDTGVSSTDNITNRNNSAAAKTLQFSISGTVSGATVNILSDGVSIGSAVASGTTTTVTTNGSALSTLSSAVHNFTATQTETGKTVSAASVALPVTIDTVAPVINATPTFSYLTGGPKVTYAVSEPVGTLTLNSFFTATNTTTSTNVPTANLVTGFSGSNVTLSFNGVAGAPSATTLLNGNYTATAAAGALTDVAGNLNTAGSTASFFWLNGDANHNRTADFNDFLALQNGFSALGNYSNGDFDYSGVVDFNDFLILQNNFGVTV